MGTGAVHKPAYLANNLAVISFFSSVSVNPVVFFSSFTDNILLFGVSYIIGSWPGLTEHTLTAFFFLFCIAVDFTHFFRLLSDHFVCPSFTSFMFIKMFCR